MSRKIELSQLSLLGIDWEIICSQLKEKIQSNIPNYWNDFISSNFGVELLEAFSWEAANLGYYVNSALNECFLNTARTKTAVFNIANQMGYRPKAAKQSSVVLTFSIPAVREDNVIIPIYTVCSGDESYFYTTESAVIYAGELSVDVNAKSGSIVSDTFICNGISEYKYKLLNNNVNSIISLTVDDIYYTQLDFIDEKNPNGLYYTLRYDSDYYGYISFGDGTYGIRPSKNNLIKVKYVVGADSDDNVESGSINSVESTIYSDGTNGTLLVSDISVTNSAYAVGGTDEESMSDIKRNTPTIYKTQKRAVTLTDYEDLIYAFGGVKSVKAIDNSIMNEIGIFGVKLCIIPKGNSNYINNAFKSEIKQYLEEKKIFSTQYEFIDPSYINFDVSADIKVLSTYDSVVVKNNVKLVILNYLDSSERELGESVSKADLYSLISNIEGVNRIDDITLSENRNCYLLETPSEGASSVKIKDDMNILTNGSMINLFNTEGKSSLICKISNINDTEYSLVDKDTLESISITSDMGLAIYNDVLPILYVDSDVKYGSKELTIKNIDISDSLLSRRNMILNNIQYSTIYFNDDTTKTYQILFRIGDVIYLDRALESDISKDSSITILYKKMIPVLFDNVGTNSSILTLTEYPRFDTGAYLSKIPEITYDKFTITARRSSIGIDYIVDYMDLQYFVNISKVYIDSSNVLVLNDDYTLGSDGTSIIWTDSGKEKVVIGKQYYIDVIKKTTEQNIVKYYVSNINGKTVTISPRTKEDFYEGQVLQYETDGYKLLPYEIACSGNIVVNANV